MTIVLLTEVCVERIELSHADPFGPLRKYAAPYAWLRNRLRRHSVCRRCVR